jgi:hypothetical protein
MYRNYSGDLFIVGGDLLILDAPDDIRRFFNGLKLPGLILIPER